MHYRMSQTVPLRRKCWTGTFDRRAIEAAVVCFDQAAAEALTEPFTKLVLTAEAA